VAAAGPPRSGQFGAVRCSLSRMRFVAVIIDYLKHGGSYVAAPQLVMQSGLLALIISGEATSVAHRGPDGWHYAISRLDQ
jgi:hypothetical protein